MILNNKVLKHLKTYLSLFILALTTLAYAHNPTIASYSLRQLDHVWILEGSFAQSGLHAAISEVHPGIIAENTPSYKEAIAEYVKSHIEIRLSDGSLWNLKEGGVRLGNHQSDVKFVLSKLDHMPESIDVSISCLAENDHQQNILRVPALGSVDHVVLTEENDFQTIINFSKPVEQKASISDSSDNMMTYFLLIIILGLIGLTSLNRRKLAEFILFMRRK